MALIKFRRTGSMLEHDREAGLPRSAGVLLLAGIVASFSGCGGSDLGSLFSEVIQPAPGAAIRETNLRIATCWSPADRQEIEQEFHQQIAGSQPSRLIWVEMPVGV